MRRQRYLVLKARCILPSCIALGLSYAARHKRTYTSRIFEAHTTASALSYVRYVWQAPRRLSPSRIPDGGGMLRIPRVFCPPAPLNRVEFPQRGIFEPTLPVLRVGRAGEDGGMPRSISPYRAWVIPPLLLPPACAGRIAVAARASPGEVTTCCDKYCFFAPFCRRCFGHRRKMRHTQVLVRRILGALSHGIRMVVPFPASV